MKYIKIETDYDEGLHTISVGNNIIGYINYYNNDNHIYIADFSINDSFSKKGYGTAVLFAIANKYNKRIKLIDKADINGFYERRGFALCADNKLIGETFNIKRKCLKLMVLRNQLYIAKFI